ncbi:MAG: magnesium transporter, partial [Sphingopyxis sp.]|nr:magnesium transporter [Sphingopyxis sp.]
MDKREEPLPHEDAVLTDDRDQPGRETETELDEDDRLRPESVRDVIDLAEAGEGE